MGVLSITIQTTSSMTTTTSITAAAATTGCLNAQTTVITVRIW